jgi:valyl-tRNA synthetase
MVLEKSDEMDWYPEFMKIRLEDWVNSLEWDWVISRQRYFATPIPLWECEKCNEVVIARIEDCYVDPTIDKPPVEKCPKCDGKLIGCEDVFDTWMDSSISPLYNTFWFRDDEKFKYLYPMSVRPQANDIIRTWAFYTILRCSLLTEEKPFENMMMGGFILSEDGTPMHASLGNVIDPINVIDEYGSDAFRCYAASCALGEDNPFRKKDVIRGVKLLRKIWNVQQFITNILKDEKPKEVETTVIDKWILTKYSKLVKNCTKQMDRYDYSQTMKDVEYFLWHELADHYLEMIKSSIYEKRDVESIKYTLYTIGLGILKLFSPFIPHITDEIYSNFYKQFEDISSIHISNWPEPVQSDNNAERIGETVKNYISQVRAWKSEQGIALNATVDSSATYASEDQISGYKKCEFVIKKTLKFPDSHTFIVGNPDIEEDIKKITPIYSNIGPIFKNDAKNLVKWIHENQEEIIKKIKQNGDILLSEIKVLNSDKKDGLLDKGYIQIQKEIMVKGKKDSTIKSFDDFYLELKVS